MTEESTGESPDNNPSDDNAPIDAPAAALIAPDPTGQSDVRYEVICELAPDDYERYGGAYRRLYDILFANAFTYFMTSARLFYQVWTEANNALVANEIRPNTDPDSFISRATMLRSTTLTLCLSLVYHQEQTLQEVCEAHGNGSDAHDKVRKLFGDLYDNFAGYRYLYGLRNVMAHDAMDAIALSATTTLDEDRRPIGIWDLRLDRSVICQSPKAKRALKDELAPLAENPSFPELFAQIAEPMRAANKALLTVIHPDLTSMCHKVVEFDGLFDGRSGTRALAHNLSPELRPGMKLGFTPWSGEAIRFAYNYEQGQEVGR
jgi:hypothetical protein